MTLNKLQENVEELRKLFVVFYYFVVTARYFIQPTIFEPGIRKGRAMRIFANFTIFQNNAAFSGILGVNSGFTANIF